MKITLNGEAYTAKEAQTLEGLLEDLGAAGQRVAVMLNGEIIKKDRRATVSLNERDTVEVIGMVGGG